MNELLSVETIPLETPSETCADCLDAREASKRPGGRADTEVRIVMRLDARSYERFMKAMEGIFADIRRRAANGSSETPDGFAESPLLGARSDTCSP